MMSTGTLSSTSLPANSADTGSAVVSNARGRAGRSEFMPGVKSSQKETVQHDNFSFGDFLNLVNPLNYIPGVSTLYQNVTAQKASPVSSLIGGAIFGGPLGFAIAGIGAVFEEATGKGVIGSIADAVTGKGEPVDQPRDYSAYYSKIANAHKPDYQWRENA